MSTPSGHGGDFFFKSYKTHLNNPNKDLKSVERPFELEKFKLDRKIFSGLKLKNSWCAGLERMTLLVLHSNLILKTTRSCFV